MDWVFLLGLALCLLRHIYLQIDADEIIACLQFLQVLELVFVRIIRELNKAYYGYPTARTTHTCTGEFQKDSQQYSQKENSVPEFYSTYLV